MATELAVQALREVIPANYTVRGEKPITLSDSEPEPDAAVVKGTARSYTNPGIQTLVKWRWLWKSPVQH